MRMLAKLGIVLVLGVGVIATVASGESDSKSGDKKTSDSSTSGAEADVTISSCGLSSNEFLGPEAKLTVKNNSSKTSNYFITVAFESADGSQQIDTGIATVSNLAPGQTAEETASSLKRETRATAGKFTCKVTKVSRFAA